MNMRKIVFFETAILTLLALLGGGILVLAYGFEPPPWFLTVELAAASAVALLCGFSARLPAWRSLLPWLRLRPVRGAALVILGVAAMHVPPQFIASAVFLALGVRLVWAEACELAEAENGPAPAREGRGLVTVQSPPEPGLSAAASADQLPTPAGKAITHRRAGVPGQIRRPC